MAVALKASAKRRQRKLQMKKATWKQLRAKVFAEYLAEKLDGSGEGLSIRPFTVDMKQFKSDVQQAIRMMDDNKAIGVDGIHVEMLKVNPEAAGDLLTEIWQVIDKTGRIPEGWLKKG